MKRRVRPHLAKEPLLEARFFPEATGSEPFLPTADWNTQPLCWNLSKLTELHRLGCLRKDKVVLEQRQNSSKPVTSKV
jgi:hypothetical protein